VKTHWFKTIMVSSGLGFGFGVLMLVIGCNSEIFPGTNLWFDSIHRPAILGAHVWSYDVRLPPQGEAAFVVVPFVAMILQWMVLAVLAGVLWNFFKQRRRNSSA